ncbi:mobilization protein [Enterocloster clostridioformis]|uniref:MobQ family relaxase n=1 Tax=Enterocloster clostridioformis TaxID=1531 RepID=UPI00080C8EDB|nr:MobQ family relaxase [Enterocloster clostridioformis]ANU48016.1 mobilization protein [Lachnoclostridium sp. YL32]NDO32538.1 mobilization protein [Enterocloster clostridioformis]OXE69269.1 mobilization protein [Enterocloster clostridioformis]QQR03991.1 MobA/MobL family protein [Enterocloster clostridioformis]
MAIYHSEAKVISRGTGRSAVAVAAYMSCSRMYNDYDGVQHDYTRKQGLVWQQVFLPDMAPAEWGEREVLWNAVEEAEKTKDSRLAREFVVALPVELNQDEWIALLTDFIQANFVAEGMCADVCIHDTDGHNPHAHIMLTVRPLTKDGKWQHKTEKEYLCVRDGEERGFTAAEFKVAHSEGWEKQYQYKVGKKKMYMPPLMAEAQGVERISKYPKSSKYVRQNPITARWNSDEQLVLWREAWADVTNRLLERAGSQERVDHRSYATRGLDEQPTIHEGVAAHVLEQKGIMSNRCELNRQIKADNALLRELKSLVKKLMNAVKDTIPAIAEVMETVRRNMLIFRYQLLHIKSSKKGIADILRTSQPDFKRYRNVVNQIKDKICERRALLEEKKAVPVIQVSWHRALVQKIAGLTEDIEELKSEKALLLNQFGCVDDHGIAEVKRRITSLENSLNKLNQQEAKYIDELEAALAQYAEMQQQVVDMDAMELEATRQAIRPGKECETAQRLQDTYRKKYDSRLLTQSRKDISDLLHEVAEPVSIREKLHQSVEHQSKLPHKKELNQER